MVHSPLLCFLFFLLSSLKNFFTTNAQQESGGSGQAGLVRLWNWVGIGLLALCLPQTRRQQKQQQQQQQPPMKVKKSVCILHSAQAVPPLVPGLRLQLPAAHAMCRQLACSLSLSSGILRVEVMRGSGSNSGGLKWRQPATSSTFLIP